MREVRIETRPGLTLDVPIHLRLAGDPTAPLVVQCHGQGEHPLRSAPLWPRLLALPVHRILPAAPYPQEVRRGDVSRIGHAWYLYDGDGPQFKESLDRAVAWLRALLLALEDRHGLRPRARALVGFSQGAYFGFAAALRNQDLFSHLVAVAGRLKEEFLHEELAGPPRLRSLILHGGEDRLVPPEASERSRRALERAGYPVELRLLPGGHELLPDRDATAASWLAGQWALAEPEAPPSDCSP